VFGVRRISSACSVVVLRFVACGNPAVIRQISSLVLAVDSNDLQKISIEFLRLRVGRL